jgi:hypothetical protein
MIFLSKQEINKRKLIESIGLGAFKKLEIDDNGGVNLRVLDIHRYDGIARLEFDKNRNEIIEGRITSPIGPRRPFWLSRGDSYLLFTQVTIVKPIPDGFRASILPSDQLREVCGFIPNGYLNSGYKGQVTFDLFVSIRIQMDEMFSVGTLYFAEIWKPVSKPQKGVKQKEKANEQRS